MRITIVPANSHRDHYDVYLGDKLGFKLRGATGKFILHDMRPHLTAEEPVIQYFHTAHAALSRVIDEVVPEGT
jgi:hypothetical protein